MGRSETVFDDGAVEESKSSRMSIVSFVLREIVPSRSSRSSSSCCVAIVSQVKEHLH